MIRYVLSAAFALMICTITILAAEVKGTLVSVDPDKNTITIKVDDKEKTYTVVDKDLKITAGKKDVTDGLKAKNFKNVGADVTLITDGDKGDVKEKVKEIQIKGKKKAAN